MAVRRAVGEALSTLGGELGPERSGQAGMTEKQSTRHLLHMFGHLTASGETTRARHRFAIGLIILSSIGFSFAGLIIRQMEAANQWHLNLYRSGFVVLVVGTLLCGPRCKAALSAFSRIGRAGLLASVLVGIAPLCFVLSMPTTTVANTVFIVATSPLFSAIGGHLFLGERVRSG